MTVMLQAAPVIIPVIGMAISPFSTLTVMLAGSFSLYSGIWTYFCSSLFLFLISPEEAMIFIFTTGALGLILGINIKNKFLKWLISSAVLSFGLLGLTYAVKIASFSEITADVEIIYVVILFFLFSSVYTAVWSYFSSRIINMIRKIT